MVVSNTRFTAAELATQLKIGTVSAVEAVQCHLDRIDDVDGDLHAFLHVSAEEALATAREVDKDRAAGVDLPPLAGVPIAVKDLICTKGIPTTAASRILEGWIPPYDASIVRNIKAARMPILGKTNLDEFAMGSSTEHSAFGDTHNPWDLDRIPGGSGGGSAVAVASYEAPLAIGTDTGGSIRGPAAFTGTVGVKPTYGSVSRYGCIAMASSLDQAGPVARNVLDTALLHEVLAGYDPRDSTSINEPVPAYADAAVHGATQDLKGVKVGVVLEMVGNGFQPGVLARFYESLTKLQNMGAEVVNLSCPSFPFAFDAYYLIMPAEVSSNLARYDGMRYGLRVEPTDGRPVTAESVTMATRGQGFGEEVKRRIILGTYALSAGYYDAFYGSAQQVRTLIQRDFAAAFDQVDVLVSPTTPTTAFKLGEKLDDVLAMYLGDVATIPANLAGVPALSMPNGIDAGLPTGFQIIAPAKEDARLYRVGAALEAALEHQWGGPLLDQAPELTVAE
ncbi:MAG: Asp-tRNA(Asn)/Glu-tRNA(Gln) amidotransferase subunit GatA [Cellulomonadaceae bacterium]|jgi:aspartyl-tRNA(Asn)/glutamyl-tRNA(Gln) amidotransferase subunit A|nr:Asp-tRNA(Asn)/Glu-tRNA(Gln) amidotransferase subunit GatA [Cellulomonadaceae bacterium]